MKTKLNSVVRILQIVLGIVFLASGVEKFLHVSGFADVIAYLLPALRASSNVVMGIATAIAAVEIILGIALMTRWAPQLVAAISGTVLLLFSFVLVRLLVDRNAPPCRCTAWITLSAKFAHTASFGIVRNACLLTIASLIWRAHKPASSQTCAADCNISA